MNFFAKAADAMGLRAPEIAGFHPPANGRFGIVACDECGAAVLLVDTQQHLDWHRRVLRD